VFRCGLCKLIIHSPIPKYHHPNSHYQPLNKKAFLQCSNFAMAVAFKFLCGNQVREPNVYAGTMGRHTSGPQRIIGTNYSLTVTMILTQFCDNNLNSEMMRAYYNDAVLGAVAPHPLLPSASGTFIKIGTYYADWRRTFMVQLAAQLSCLPISGCAVLFVYSQYTICSYLLTISRNMIRYRHVDWLCSH